MKYLSLTEEWRSKLPRLRAGEGSGTLGVGVKSRSSTPELPLIQHILSPEEVGGIPSVEVKFVDIRKNTGGEGGFLART